MNFKNATFGIAVGLIIVGLIKRTDAETGDSSTSATVQTVSTSTGTPTLVTSDAVKPETSFAKKENQTVASIHVTTETPSNDLDGFDHDSSRLKRLLQESIEPAQVTNPTQSELDEFEQLFLATVQRSQSWKKLTEGWSRGGWNLDRWTADGDKFVAISEQSDQRRGRGIYVIRLDTHSPITLQAPHRFFDTKTGLLTRKLFTENDVLAAAWNTVHRKQFDLAHRSDHFINAMTRALIKFDTSTVIAQVHGFANDKQTGAANSASVIISDTTQYPGRLARRVSEGLKETFGADLVRLYPSEVSQLGGTTNQQARVFHRFGQTGFLHVELSHATRGKLVTEASLRSEFFSALTSAVANRNIPPNR